MGNMFSSVLGYCEDLDFDSEIRKQWRVLNRKIISPEFDFNRLPLAAVLKTA